MLYIYIYIYIYMYTNEIKSCLKSVNISAVVPCFVVGIRGCVVTSRWVDLRTVFLWWILGPCDVPGYPFSFLGLYFRWTYVRCACVRSCVVFRLSCTILLWFHVCILLRGVSVPCFCCPLAITVACCVSFLYVCMVVVCSLSLVAV